MNPFYFGTSERRLFGIYTPAQSARARAPAIVLCHPWGQEYLFAHRSIRQLGSMLSAAGFHILRFDYGGTGDSAGDMRQADLKGWQEDIEMAIEELKDMSGATRVGLIGLRLGATLAAAVAARRPGDVDGLVLWDPIVSGEEYLAELIQGPLTGPPAAKGTSSRATGDEGEREVRGFLLTIQMARGLRGLDLAALAPAVAARTLAVVSAGAEANAAVRASLEGRVRGPLDIEQIESTPAWVKEVGFGMDSVAITTMQRIVEWLR